MGKREKYKKRTQAERARDTKAALALHYDGFSIREIAESQKRKPSSVFVDIKKATSKAQEANQQFIQEKLMESFSTLELAESEALEGWYQSLEDAERSRLVKKVGDKDNFEQTVKESMGQSGNPQYLNILVKVQIAKAKLFESMNIQKSQNSIWDKLFDQIKGRSHGPKKPGK